MANRREEERARLREAREEREKKHTSTERRRLMIAYGVAGAIGVIVIAGIVAVIASSGGGGGGGESSHIDQQSGSTNGVQPDDREGTPPPAAQVIDLKQAAKEAGCDLRLHLKDEGHTHLQVGSEAPEYKTNPPTSGNHVEPPYQQADGAYSEMPLLIDMVHSLEHGRMEIQYSPDLPEKQQLELKGLYETMYGGTLFFPNGEMPYAVAGTTWTNLLGCRQYKGAITLDALRAFGKATWNRYGTEQERIPYIGPTPRNPAS